MSGYEIDVARRHGADGFRTCRTGVPSLNRAKAICTGWRRGQWRGHHDTSLVFRIYADNGERLVLVNAPDSGWRLRWVPGNGKPRAEQPAITQHAAEG